MHHLSSLFQLAFHRDPTFPQASSGAWQCQYLGLCLSYFPLRNNGKHCWYIRKMHHKTGFCPILTLRAYSAGVSSELVSEPHVRDRNSLVFQSIRVRVEVTTESSRIELYV